MHVRLFVWLIGCIVFFSSPPNLKLRRQFGATPTVAALCIAPHLITSWTQPAMAQIAASPPAKQPDTSRQPPSMARQPPGASQTSPRSQFLPRPPRHVWRGRLRVPACGCASRRPWRSTRSTRGIVRHSEHAHPAKVRHGGRAATAHRRARNGVERGCLACCRCRIRRVARRHS